MPVTARPISNYFLPHLPPPGTLLNISLSPSTLVPQSLSCAPPIDDTNQPSFSNLSAIFALEPSPPSFHHHNLLKVGVLTSLFVLSLIGNLRTLSAVIKRRRMTSQTHRSLNILIFHLCLADLLVTFFCILGDSLWNITIQWLAGNVMCKLVKFFQFASLCLSTYVMMLISLDRVCAVLYPIHYTKKWHLQVNVTVAIAWLASGLLSVPQMIMFSVYRGPFKEDFFQCSSMSCDPPLWQKRIYPIGSVILMFFLPLATMLSSYGLIVYTIIKKSKEYSRLCIEVDQISPDMTTGSSPDYVANNLAGSSSSNSLNRPGNRSSRNTGGGGSATGGGGAASSSAIARNKTAFLDRAKIKSFQMSAVIIITFVISWSPYWVLFLLSTFADIADESILRIISELSHWLFCFGMLNSALNPIIYGYFNNRWCQTSGRRRRHHGENPPAKIMMRVTWRPPKVRNGGASSSSSEGQQGGFVLQAKNHNFH